MVENKRYHFEDFGDYCTITDTEKYPKKLEDFIQDYVNEGFLEDFTREEITEMAEEKVQEYFYDNGMTGRELADRLNQQETRINELKKCSQDYEDVVSNFFLEHWLDFSKDLKDEIILLFDIDGDAE